MASSKTALIYYYRFTIIPKLIRICEAINHGIIEKIDPDMFLWFEDIIPEDEQQEIAKEDLRIRQEQHDITNGIRTVEQIMKDREQEKNK